MGFGDHIRSSALERGVTLPREDHPEPLANLDYEVELAIKRAALERFWREERLAARPGPIVAAPAPRGYRTTTKRRAMWSGRLTLSFPGLDARPGAAAPSRLDAPSHVRAYADLVDRLHLPAYRPLASVLQWVILRGDPERLALILNVHTIDARVVRAAKTLAQALLTNTLGILSCHLFVDPSRSDYYLEAGGREERAAHRRLSGPADLRTTVGGVRLVYPPIVFSQVNGPMLETLVDQVRDLLSPLEGAAMLDLYCGYGLFSLTVGSAARQVTGVDLDGPAIRAARANAEHLSRAAHARFLAGRIDASFLERQLRRSRPPEVVLLDPPRQGTAPGVADAVAARNPARILHICCGADEIPRELESWRRAGYELTRVVPLDLFAGTNALETLLVLEPRGAGRS